MLEEIVRGKLIVIDGIDGSGKKEHTERLVNRLRAEGYPVKTVSFPRYGTPAAANVEKYLRGGFGPKEGLDPKRVSDYYADDRADMAPALREYLSQGFIVVSNRYTSANVGHQSIRLTSIPKQDEFIRWLFFHEYVELGIPEPDATIVCHMEYDVAVRNIMMKDSKRDDRGYLQGAKMDIHEADPEHLKKAIAAYERASRILPGWHLVACCRDGENKPYEEIHEMVWDIVKRTIESCNRQYT